MDFYSAYAQGFVAGRRLHDPGGRSRTPRPTRPACWRRREPATTRAWPLAVFPELSLSGYSIDDLLLQDTLLDAVRGGARRDRRGLRRPAAGAGRRRAAACTAPGSTTAPWSIHRRRDPRGGAEVLPADLPRVLRAPAVRPRRRPARRVDRPGRARGAVRPRPALRGRRPARLPCCTSRSARTCGCRCRRARRRRWPARRCWPTCPAARSRSAAPRTAGCWCRSASARCLAAYVYAAAGPGRVDHRPVLGRPDDDLRERRPARRDRALPRRRRAAASPTSTSTGCARSGCGRAPSTTTARTASATARRRRCRDRSQFDRSSRPAGDIGLRRKVDRFPFVPDDPDAAGAGLLRGLQHPGRRAGAAAARDRPARRS